MQPWSKDEDWDILEIINGTVTTDIVEELFDDGVSSDPNPENGGTNRTGTYVARVKLNGDIPEYILHHYSLIVWIKFSIM